MFSAIWHFLVATLECGVTGNFPDYRKTIRMGTISYLASWWAISCMTILATGTVNAQPLPTKLRPFVLIQLAADRGLECDLLSRWQAAVLRAQIIEETQKWDADTRKAFSVEVMQRAEITPCDDPAITTWASVAQRGFESEYLPPYLVIYRAIARLDHPPALFTSISLRVDYETAIGAIDAKLEALEASGTIAEGGKPWPESIARIESVVPEFVAALRTGETLGRTSPDQAAAYIGQSALVTELWLQEAR